MAFAIIVRALVRAALCASWPLFPVAILAGTGAEAQAASGDQVAAGMVRTIGAYPQERGLGHTVTALPDGRVFVYGHNPHAQSLDSVILEPRLRSAGKNEVPPVIWDPTLHAWRRIDSPPQCPNMAYLQTATVLSDGRILIGGGLCDTPRPRGDTRSAAPYKALSIWNDKSRKWEAAPSLAESRIYHTATLLDDDSVLFVGGERDGREHDGTEPVLASVELFRAGKIVQLHGLQVPRAKHTATRMPDGSVIVVGGMATDGTALGSVELRDPATQTWREGPALKTPRYRHTATLLSDGRLLVAGGSTRQGEDISSVEILDPSKTAWTDATSLPQSFRRHSAIVLDNDDVLVAGVGFDRAHSTSRVMLWEEATGEWYPAGHLFPDRYRDVQSYQLTRAPGKNEDVLLFDSRLVMRWSRSGSGATLDSPFGRRQGYAVAALNDGRVMLAGGRGALPGGRIGQVGSDMVEIVDPRSGRISVTGRLNGARASLSTLTLDDGSVVAASDEVGRTMDPKPLPPKFAEVWNPASGKWRVITELNFSTAPWVYLERFGKLADGRVLFLFFDGEYERSNYRAAIWYPRTREVKVASMGIDARRLASISILPDGRVLIVGGYKGEGDVVWDPQVWDSRTGRVEPFRFPPEWQAYLRKPAESKVLKDGSVLFVEHAYQSHKTALVAIWSATSGNVRGLPPLPVGESWTPNEFRIVELADGSLFVNSFLLTPGGTSWVAVTPPPQSDATPIVLPSGRLAAFSSSTPHVAYFDQDTKQWQLKADYYLQRKEEPKPALVELSDGRVMVSGSLDIEGWPKETMTQIWDPKRDRWGSLGRLNGVYTGPTEAALLPSGQVLQVGANKTGWLQCEVGHPSDNAWNDCNAPAVRVPPQFALKPLLDKRIAFIPSSGDAYVYDEPDKQWLPIGPSELRTLVRDSSEPHASWARLPDGCFISGPPFRIFNPKTGKEIRVNQPVTGQRSGSGRLIALPDGTVVVAGYPEGTSELNSGFFHRRASCEGFVQEAEDSIFMPGIYWTPSAAEVSSTPKATSWESFLHALEPFRWIPLALAVPILMYGVLRRLVQRVNAADGPLVLRPWVEKTTRWVISALIIGGVLYFFAPLLYQGYVAPWTQSNVSDTHPCQFVGVWSSSRSGAVYVITLSADGRYSTDQIDDGTGKMRAYNGTWEVRGDTMVWRHEGIDHQVADVNPIREESGGAFTLIEVNGSRSEFKRLENGRSDCG